MNLASDVKQVCESHFRFRERKRIKDLDGIDDKVRLNVHGTHMDLLLRSKICIYFSKTDSVEKRAGFFSYVEPAISSHNQHYGDSDPLDRLSKRTAVRDRAAAVTGKEASSSSIGKAFG